MSYNPYYHYTVVDRRATVWREGWSGVVEIGRFATEEDAWEACRKDLVKRRGPVYR